MSDQPPSPYADGSPPAAEPSRPPSLPAVPKRLPQPDDFPDTGPNALASFTQRAWARVIDEVITDIPFAVGFSLLAASTLTADGQRTADTDKLSQDVPLWLLVATVLLGVLYEIVAVRWKGKTIGKWALGIRVARYADGKGPNWGQASLRCLLPAAAGVVAFRFTAVSAFGAFLIFATAYFNPLRRGWHDDAGGTIVVRTR